MTFALPGSRLARGARCRSGGCAPFPIVAYRESTAGAIEVCADDTSARAARRAIALGACRKLRSAAGLVIERIAVPPVHGRDRSPAWALARVGIGRANGDARQVAAQQQRKRAKNAGSAWKAHFGRTAWGSGSFGVQLIVARSRMTGLGRCRIWRRSRRTAAPTAAYLPPTERWRRAARGPLPSGAQHHRADQCHDRLELETARIHEANVAGPGARRISPQSEKAVPRRRSTFAGSR
jgi:hypothetical protein